ncbi:hypothetical protein [Paraburkholderia ultramafica]|uniref:hypothetical protein n=1 Tax=Paraburkholderia ultramafica TaxID=1544867 RepID=UPI0015826BBE|nr:hypothetical protein [Paraburkholderia ultramafica]
MPALSGQKKDERSAGFFGALNNLACTASDEILLAPAWICDADINTRIEVVDDERRVAF